MAEHESAGLKPAPTNPHTWAANSGIADFIRQADRPDSGYPNEPFSADVKAGKGTSFYRAHTYHTKVPPQGIEKFIAHYTQPGQIVMDPFCGSGMTGIAAIRQGRRAILSDISPAATFFAHNHCRAVDADAFLRAGKQLLNKVQQQYGWLYATQRREASGEVPFEKMLWSRTLGCPECGGEYSLWEAALDDNRKVREQYPCPRCNATITKKASRRVGWKPIRVDYIRPKTEAAIDDADLELIERIEQLPWPGGLWYPTDPIPRKADEIGRLHHDDITTIDGLFTRRALLCVAALWREASRADKSLRPSLQFAVTGVMQRASRLNKFIPSLNISPGPILGTMYIPGFYPEMNVFRLFERKLNAIAKAHRDLRNGTPASRNNECCISTQSATDLSNVPDDSIDYVFTDPPFGSNIQYSELNLLWESWLKQYTNAQAEAVVSKTQQKSVGDYADLMARAFCEIRRVLKPGGWMTLVFHNSAGEVWAAIQQALEAAGLHVGAIHTFDKAHDTFKMVTAPGAVGFDVVVNCRKTGDEASPCQAPFAGDEAADTGRGGFQTRPGEHAPDAAPPADLDAAREFVRRCIATNTTTQGDASSPRRLHARAIAHFIAQKRSIAFDYREFRLMVLDELTGISDE